MPAIQASGSSAGVRQVVYAKKDLSLRDQLAAVTTLQRKADKDAVTVPQRKADGGGRSVAAPGHTTPGDWSRPGLSRTAQPPEKIISQSPGTEGDGGRVWS